MSTTPEHDLARIVKRSHGFFRDAIDLADMQGFTLTARNNGVQFRREGSGCTFVHDPGNDSAAQRIVKYKLECIGLRFPQQHKRAPNMKHNGIATAMEAASPPAIVTPAPVTEPKIDLFAQARLKINQGITVLSELESIIGEIEKDNAHIAKLRELFKALSP